MVVFLVSECSNTVNRLRDLLRGSGHECPFSHVALYSFAVESVAAARPKAEIVVFVMSPDIERTQDVLRQLRASSSAHILAIGPRDPKAILCAVRAGAQDYLEEDDLSKALTAALARIAETVQQRSPAGQLTTVISASGGCGKTLVAANLAVQLAKTNTTCGLFDFDLEGSDVATFLGLKPRYTIADLCRNIDTLDHKMWEQSLLSHDSSLRVLAGPETWEDARQISSEDLQKILRFGRSQFAHVVVDLDSCWLQDRAQILLESTAILLLFRLDFASVRNAARAVQYLTKFGVPSANVHFTVARHVKNTDISASQAEAALGMSIRHFIPEDSQIVDASVNCGSPVVTEAPRSAFAKAVGSIAGSLAPATPQPDKQSHEVEEPVPGTALMGSFRTFLKMCLRECSLRTSQV
jgi:pilus assembly protein CpaE